MQITESLVALGQLTILESSRLIVEVKIRPESFQLSACSGESDRLAASAKQLQRPYQAQGVLRGMLLDQEVCGTKGAVDPR